MNIRKLISVAAVACLSITAPIAAQQSRGDERAEAITNQIERLVSTPQKIALSQTQRLAVDSLKTSYLKEAKAIEAATGSAGQMQSVMKIRALQNEYRDRVQKILKSDQIEDFLKNVQAASNRTMPPA